MKEMTDYLPGGNLDLGIALAIFMPEPKRTLALNTILIHCLQESSLKYAEKVATLLGRKLNDLELKIIVDRYLKDLLMVDAKEASSKMLEPNRTRNLVLVYQKYYHLFFSNGWSEKRDDVIDAINLMTEPSRTIKFNDFFEGHLKRPAFANRIIELSKAINRTLTASDLQKAFDILYKSLIDSDGNSHFYDLINILSLMGAPDKINNRDLLLEYCLKKQSIEYLKKLTELLEEPDLTATLNIIFNLQFTKNDNDGAIKTADKMSEPFRSVILNRYFNDYVSKGLSEKAEKLAAMMGVKIQERHWLIMAKSLLDQKDDEAAWGIAKKLDDNNLKTQILNQSFKDYLAKGWYQRAYERVFIMQDENSKVEAAQALFDKVIVAPQWLSLCGSLPPLFKEVSRPPIIKKTQARYLDEGNVAQIALAFKGDILNKTYFDKLLNRIEAGNLLDKDFQELFPVLSEQQKSDYLMICAKFFIRNNRPELSSLLPLITEDQKAEYCREIAEDYVEAGNYPRATLTLRLINETVSEADLKIVLRKNIADGLYREAVEIAGLLKVELTLDDLGTILKSSLENGNKSSAPHDRMKIAMDLAEIIVAKI